MSQENSYIMQQTYGMGDFRDPTADENIDPVYFVPEVKENPDSSQTIRVVLTEWLNLATGDKFYISGWTLNEDGVTYSLTWSKYAVFSDPNG